MAIGDKEISIGIVVVTLILLGAWVAIFFSMKTNQIGLFTPYVPPGMMIEYDDSGDGGVSGGSSSAEKRPIYVPDLNTTEGNYFYPLGVQGYMGDNAACARKSLFIQAKDEWETGNGTSSSTNVPVGTSGIKFPAPAHWMVCYTCTGEDWQLDSGSVDDLFASYYPNLTCRQPDDI